MGKLWIFEIYLLKLLYSIVLGSWILVLCEDYKFGCLCGCYFFVMVGKLLIEKVLFICYLVLVVMLELIVILFVLVVNDMLVVEVSDVL